MSTLFKTIDDITRTKTSLDGTERIPSRDDLGDFKITVDNLKASIVSSPVKSTAVSYVILDDDNFSRIEVDTTAGDITITLPLKANNLAREIEIANVKGGTNKVIIATNAGNPTTLSNDALSVMWLPKVGDFVKFRESQTSGYWEITNERITSQLRLNTYAGYGSTDNKIMRFTNVVENVGNMFSENHVSGYSGNAKGLEITINRSGKYSFNFNNMAAVSQNVSAGLSLNSNQLTTNIQSITASNIASLSWGGSITNGYQGLSTSLSIFLKKGDMIRPHTEGFVPITATSILFSCTYLGN